QLCQLFAQRRPVESWNKECDAFERQLCKEIGVEVVTMLVADIYEPLFLRFAKLVRQPRTQMMVARELKPSRVKCAFGGQPRVHDQDEALCFDKKAGVAEVSYIHLCFVSP